MHKVFLDTNIIIDIALDRKPFSEESFEILSLCEKGLIKGYISTITIVNCYYILRKSPKHLIDSFVRDILKFIELCDTSALDIQNVYDSEYIDFEDAVQNQIAIRSKCSTVITRDENDFSNSKLKILAPKEFIALYIN